MLLFPCNVRISFILTFSSYIIHQLIIVSYLHPIVVAAGYNENDS